MRVSITRVNAVTSAARVAVAAAVARRSLSRVFAVLLPLRASITGVSRV